MTEGVREGEDKRLAKSFFRGITNTKPDLTNGSRFLALTFSRELDTRVWLKFYRAEYAGIHASQCQRSHIQRLLFHFFFLLPCLLYLLCYSKLGICICSGLELGTDLDLSLSLSCSLNLGGCFEFDCLAGGDGEGSEGFDVRDHRVLCWLSENFIYYKRFAKHLFYSARIQPCYWETGGT